MRLVCGSPYDNTSLCLSPGAGAYKNEWDHAPRHSLLPPLARSSRIGSEYLDRLCSFAAFHSESTMLLLRRRQCKLRRLRRGRQTVLCGRRLCSTGLGTTMRLFSLLPLLLTACYGFRTRRPRRAAVGRYRTFALRRRNTTHHSSPVRTAERRRSGQQIDFAALHLAMYRLGERKSHAVQEEGNPSQTEMVVQRQNLPAICRPSLPREPEPRPSPSELIDGCCTCNAVQEQGVPNNRAEIVVGCCNWQLQEPRNTRQEQENPNPAEMVYI